MHLRILPNWFELVSTDYGIGLELRPAYLKACGIRGEATYI